MSTPTSPPAHTPPSLPAKHPRTALAGPYGHPFHPILVTVPIGTWLASLVFDIAATVSDDPSAFATGSLWLIGIGLVGALLAAVFGILDLTTIPTGTRAFLTGVTHMALNLAVTALFALGFVIRLEQGTDSVGTFPMVLSVLALILLGASGWLGGLLSYHYGVRVADERTQADGFR